MTQKLKLSATRGVVEDTMSRKLKLSATNLVAGSVTGLRDCGKNSLGSRNLQVA